MQLLEYMAAKRMLDRYKLRSIESRYVNSAEDAAKFAGNDAIVLKGISNKALHKSKAGLVELDLTGKEVGKAYERIKKRARRYAPYKILAQKMARKGIEIIIGGNTDPQFGKVILIGLGGIYVEAFRDVALRLCPIKRIDAEEMIDQLRSRNVITYNSKNTKMIVDLLMKTSSLLSRNQNIEELDLNPIIVREKDYDVVDIRILK